MFLSWDDLVDVGSVVEEGSGDLSLSGGGLGRFFLCFETLEEEWAPLSFRAPVAAGV